MAWTSPRRTFSSMSRLATTPGKRLVMPRSSTAKGTALVLIAPLYSFPHVNGGWERRKPALPASVRRPGASRSGGHRDLAADDLLLVVVELGLDVVDETARRGQADAVGLQVVQHVLAALVRGLAGDEVVDERLHGQVDPLEHRGHDERLQRGVTDRVVLVGVDPDRPLVRGGRGLEDAETRATGSVVDDVGTGVVHALRHDLALGRVVEAGEVTGRRDVLHVDLDVGLRRRGAGHVARLELLDQRGLDAADEA